MYVQKTVYVWFDAIHCWRGVSLTVSPENNVEPLAFLTEQI
jgi:hypothetical protein